MSIKITKVPSAPRVIKVAISRGPTSSAPPASPTPAPAVTLDDIRLELLKLESQMDGIDGWNLHNRWKSGRLLVSMRDPNTNYLPKGRLTTVAATLKVSTRELSDRMRVADVYRTDTAFKTAARGQTWRQVVNGLEKTREARMPPARSRNWRQQLSDALAHVLADRLLKPTGRSLAQKLYDYLEAEGGDE